MKPFLFSLLCIFSFATAPAQNQPNYRTNLPKVHLFTKYPGYIVTRTGDTLKGYIMLKNLVRNEEVAIFYKHASDKKYTQKFRPKKVLAYKVGPRYYESTNLNLPFLIRLTMPDASILF